MLLTLALFALLALFLYCFKTTVYLKINALLAIYSQILKEFHVLKENFK